MYHTLQATTDALAQGSARTRPAHKPAWESKEGLVEKAKSDLLSRWLQISQMQS